MTSNDNRPPLSPLGKAVFDMLNNINEVSFTSIRVAEETEKMRQRHPARVISPIVRIGERVKP